MLKFELTARETGKKMIGIGLSTADIDLMRAGKPRSFSLEQFGFENCDIIVLAGETEDAIVAELTNFVEDRREQIEEGHDGPR